MAGRWEHLAGGQTGGNGEQGMARGRMVQIDIEGISQLQRMALMLDPDNFEKILYTGLDYAAKATPPAVAKAISSRYNITSSRVKEETSGPYVRGEGEDMVATLRFSRRPPTGMQYKPRMVGPNLQLRPYKGATTVVQHGFIGTMRGRQFTLRPDFRKLFGPDERADSGRRHPRFALDVVYGPSLGSIFLGQSAFGDEIRQEVNDRISEMFNKGVQRELDRQARGFGR